MATDRTSLKLERDAVVSNSVVSVGEECLRLCDSLVAAAKIDHATRTRFAWRRASVSSTSLRRFSA